MNSSDNANPILKSVYEYSDYRSFLRDYYEHSKAVKRGFSYRVFARICGFKSSNFLMLVMNGKSSLTSVSVEKVVRGIKLNRDEAHFFRHLVAFTDAKTSSLKATHAQEMLRSKNLRKIFPLREAQYRYLGTWSLPVIRSVVGLPDFKFDAKWVSERMSPPLDPSEVEQSFRELLALGLLKKDEAGKLVQTEGMISTPAEIASSFAAQYHRQMMERASESIDRFKRDQRHLIGATVALDAASVARIKELAEKFRLDVMEVAAASEHTNAIYQMSMQFFPLFQVSRKETEKK